MIVMSKDEIRVAIRLWPANAKAPIDRDVQIKLMQTAAKRHEEKINKKDIL